MEKNTPDLLLKLTLYVKIYMYMYMYVASVFTLKITTCTMNNFSKGEGKKSDIRLII